VGRGSLGCIRRFRGGWAEVSGNLSGGFGEPGRRFRGGLGEVSGRYSEVSGNLSGGFGEATRRFRGTRLGAGGAGEWFGCVVVILFTLATRWWCVWCVLGEDWECGALGVLIVGAMDRCCCGAWVGEGCSPLWLFETGFLRW
jgi:hypothetical protein